MSGARGMPVILVKTLNDLCKEVDAITEIAKTAKKNGKSLKSSGFYANKFHQSVLRLGKLNANLTAQLGALELDASILTEAASLIELVSRPDLALQRRVQCGRNLRLLCES